jgi:hypothetical protein
MVGETMAKGEESFPLGTRPPVDISLYPRSRVAKPFEVVTFHHARTDSCPSYDGVAESGPNPLTAPAQHSPPNLS